MLEERLSCIDDYGLETEPRLRSECHKNPALLHRVIHVMVENSQGRILMQRRSQAKDIQPGMWDMAVGGHLIPGEVAYAGAVREFMEELGVLEQDVPEFVEMYQYTWITDIESEKVTSFHARSDGPFSPDEGEVDMIAFFSPVEIDELIQSKSVTPNFQYEWSLHRKWRKSPDIVLNDYPVFGICHCHRCERLTDFRCSIQGKGKLVKADYWNRPVPGFGDLNARILVVGLAPGAHGANRTGRPFTGDAAGDVLFRALYRIGLSSRPDGYARGDGLTLTDVFITNAVKCVPPDNRPKPDEADRCIDWFQMELDALANLRMIICLGRLAFESVRKSLIHRVGNSDNFKGVAFGHGVRFDPGSGLPGIGGLYHPSRRNLNTGLITSDSFCDLFEKLCKDA
ncbi:NUDIX domain-containing protein [bacterium]|nr:NUDIX domain-containing protein [candidate division CSSED10-310 bacterium]